MKKSRVFQLLGLVLVLSFVFGMTNALPIASAGTALSEDNQSSLKAEDCLIGILITQDYLVNKVVADYVQDTYIDSDSGESYPEDQYLFQGVKGSFYYSPIMDSGDSQYRGSYCEGAWSDCHEAINVTDTSNDLSLEGTITMSTDSNISILHMNPVYQSSTGEVYAIPGSGAAFTESSVGMSQSHSISASSTQTINEAVTSVSASVKVNIRFSKHPGTINVLQMDCNNLVLESTVYEPGKLPEKISVTTGCEYIIAETIFTDATSSRELIQKDTSALKSLHCDDEGFCLTQYTDIEW